MNGVSAQDNFTKWAKLRRQHDKAVQQYEKSCTYSPPPLLLFPYVLVKLATDGTFPPAQAVQSSRSTFDSTLKTLRFALTTGVRLLLQFWYSKRALFWLPKGWVPFYVEWILSFPRAPMGSISIQVWGIACASVIAMCSEAIIAGYNIGTKKTEDRNKEIGGGKAKAEPMAFGAGGEKKEL